MARTGRTQDAGARLAPQDVLAGQVAPSARDLIRLIHQVNPAGQDMTKREAERRYLSRRPKKSVRRGSLGRRHHPERVALEPGRVGIEMTTRNVEIKVAWLQNPDTARGTSMRRDFKISRSAGALLNRSLLRVAKQGASVLAWIACAATHPPCGQAEALPVPIPGRDASVAEGDSTRIAREAMVQEQIEARGVRNAAVLADMRRVPRHEFMPENVRPLAYYDRPVPIGLGQTISQPYIVALMTELAAVGRGSRVLEIGTGSGYQAAVLAELGADVYSIEILAPLQERAVEILARLGYGQVKTRVGDGYMGWPEAAPFDAIIVTAAPARVPEPLKQQLKVGGRLVLPVGRVDQELEVITRTALGFSERSVIPVRFVPMTGKADEKR